MLVTIFKVYIFCKYMMYIFFNIMQNIGLKLKTTNTQLVYNMLSLKWHIHNYKIVNSLTDVSKINFEHFPDYGIFLIIHECNKVCNSHMKNVKFCQFKVQGYEKFNKLAALSTGKKFCKDSITIFNPNKIDKYTRFKLFFSDWSYW